jgi:hypothetical protein
MQISEIDTLAVKLEGVPSIPAFFSNPKFSTFERIQENKFTDSEKKTRHTIACDTGKAYYQYDNDNKTLRYETSRRRFGNSLDNYTGDLTPDGYYIEHLDKKIIRTDECVNIPMDLRRFASAYGGPSRTKKLLFENTGSIYKKGKLRLRIYDKRKEQSRKPKEQRDPRFISGQHWRIESSYIGNKAVTKAGYSFPIRPIEPLLLKEALEQLLIYLTYAPTVYTLKPSVSAFARFALAKDKTLWPDFVKHLGGSSTKNLRRLSALLGITQK